MLLSKILSMVICCSSCIAMKPAFNVELSQNDIDSQKIAAQFCEAVRTVEKFVPACKDRADRISSLQKSLANFYVEDVLSVDPNVFYALVHISGSDESFTSKKRIFQIKRDVLKFDRKVLFDIWDIEDDIAFVSKRPERYTKRSEVEAQKKSVEIFKFMYGQQRIRQLHDLALVENFVNYQALVRDPYKEFYFLDFKSGENKKINDEELEDILIKFDEWYRSLNMKEIAANAEDKGFQKDVSFLIGKDSRYVRAIIGKILSESDTNHYRLRRLFNKLLEIESSYQSTGIDPKIVNTTLAFAIAGTKCKTGATLELELAEKGILFDSEDIIRRIKSKGQTLTTEKYMFLGAEISKCIASAKVALLDKCIGSGAESVEEKAFVNNQLRSFIDLPIYSEKVNDSMYGAMPRLLPKDVYMKMMSSKEIEKLKHQCHGKAFPEAVKLEVTLPKILKYFFESWTPEYITEYINGQLSLTDGSNSARFESFISWSRDKGFGGLKEVFKEEDGYKIDVTIVEELLTEFGYLVRSPLYDDSSICN